MLLDEIIGYTKQRVSDNKKRNSIQKLKDLVFEQEIDMSFLLEKILENHQDIFILEIKKYNPNKERIVHNFNYKDIALEYQSIGAHAISVVTEPDFFYGDDDYLKVISSCVDIPVIRKDYIIDEYMIYESKLLGASAIVLLAGVLDEITLNRYLNLARQLGLSCIVEIHSTMQLKKALRCQAKIICINNRNIQDYSLDYKGAKELIPLINNKTNLIVTGGLRKREDIKEFKQLGVKNFEIGQTILRSLDRQTTFNSLRGLFEK